MKNDRDTLRPLHTLAALLLGLLLLVSSVPGLAQSSIRNFDHTQTGFQLSGVHSSQRCETCHINGIFKGTPRDCEKCHVSGNRWATNHNIVKPPQHLQTLLPCDTCHNTVTFSGARFNHMGVTPGTQCASCHNGMTAAGKPSGHIVTSGNCGDCHRTTAWLPAAKPDHSGFTTATNCASCHNGANAVGKPGNHMPTTLNCIACHSPMGSAFTPNSWNHAQQPVANQCASCHTGGYLSGMGRPGNHIPYQVLAGVAITNCDSCHKAGFSTWYPGTFHNNVAISNQCATCHLSGAYGLTSKPGSAIHASVTGNCEACHKTTSAWTAARPDHSLFTAATNCASCHNGIAATGKPSNHMPTTLNCIACHSATAALFTPNSWNHTQMPVTNQCASCHTGGYLSGMGKPGNHIPYQLIGVAAGANCDGCHKAGFSTWYPGRFHANFSVSTQCATCHLSSVYGLTSKPSTAIHATVTGNCENCHKTTSAWTASKPDHSLFTAATNCASCHNNVAATGKPSNHMPTTLNCIACHSPTGALFTPNSWNHTQMPVTAQCATCHTGSYLSGMGKPSNHIPYQLIGASAGANCDTCHRAGFTTWYPGRFHANVTVTGQCSTCHGSGVYGLTTKPANHIPVAQLLNGTSLECNACHLSTTTWTSERMNHNSSMGSGAGWCIACHATGTSYLGSMQKMALNHRGGTTVKVDCSQSGCHRPLGSFGAAYTKWN